jgi:hypothetical protein
MDKAGRALEKVMALLGKCNLYVGQDANISVFLTRFTGYQCRRQCNILEQHKIITPAARQIIPQSD